MKLTASADLEAAFAGSGLHAQGQVREQFLLQAMLARNLAVRFKAPLVVAVCAILFAVDHMPDWPLVGATLLLALAMTPLYLRFRSLIPLAVVHGWLGSLFYVWILGRDPIGVFFGIA